MRRSVVAAALAALAVPAGSAAALEVKLSVVPALPKVGAQSVVQVRPYWTYKRPDGTCCRLVAADVKYAFRIQAVSPAGRIFRVGVRKTRNRYVWAGSFRFRQAGGWTVRAPQWGPRYNANSGARPKIRFSVR